MLTLRDGGSTCINWTRSLPVTAASICHAICMNARVSSHAWYVECVTNLSLHTERAVWQLPRSVALSQQEGGRVGSTEYSVVGTGRYRVQLLHMTLYIYAFASFVAQNGVAWMRRYPHRSRPRAVRPHSPTFFCTTRMVVH
jgi:hypothetical protein